MRWVRGSDPSLTSPSHAPLAIYWTRHLGLVPYGPLRCREVLSRTSSMASEKGAAPRLPLRPTASAMSGNTANGECMTPTAIWKIPKRNAAYQIPGSSINKKGTALALSPTAPIRKAASKITDSTRGQARPGVRVR